MGDENPAKKFFVIALEKWIVDIWMRYKEWSKLDTNTHVAWSLLKEWYLSQCVIDDYKNKLKTQEIQRVKDGTQETQKPFAPVLKNRNEPLEIGGSKTGSHSIDASVKKGECNKIFSSLKTANQNHSEDILNSTANGKDDCSYQVKVSANNNEGNCCFSDVLTNKSYKYFGIANKNLKPVSESKKLADEKDISAFSTNENASNLSNVNISSNEKGTNTDDLNFSASEEDSSDDLANNTDSSKLSTIKIQKIKSESKRLSNEKDISAFSTNENALNLSNVNISSNEKGTNTDDLNFSSSEEDISDMAYENNNTDNSKLSTNKSRKIKSELIMTNDETGSDLKNILTNENFSNMDNPKISTNCMDTNFDNLNIKIVENEENSVYSTIISSDFVENVTDFPNKSYVVSRLDHNYVMPQTLSLEKDSSTKTDIPGQENSNRPMVIDCRDMDNMPLSQRLFLFNLTQASKIQKKKIRKRIHKEDKNKVPRKKVPIVKKPLSKQNINPSLELNGNDATGNLDTVQAKKLHRKFSNKFINQRNGSHSNDSFKEQLPFNECFYTEKGDIHCSENNESVKNVNSLEEAGNCQLKGNNSQSTFDCNEFPPLTNSISREIYLSERIIELSKKKRKSLTKQERAWLISALIEKNGKKALGKAVKEPNKKNNTEKKKGVPRIVYEKTKDWVKPFACDICEMSFTRQSTLNNHKRIHTKIYRCKVRGWCGATFTNYEDYEKHKPGCRAKRNGAFRCKICKKPFNKRQSLRDHVAKFPEQHSDCTVCKKPVNADCMEDHLRQHNGEKLHQCETCGMMFFTQSKLERHQVIEHNKNITKYNCKICGKIFLKQYRCLIHERKFDHKLTATCHYCGKEVSKKYLKYHLRKHTGEKPYCCDVCGKCFPFDFLKGHMRIHTGERPYKCNYCDRTFAIKGNKHLHMRRIHKKELRLEQVLVETKVIAQDQLTEIQSVNLVEFNPTIVEPLPYIDSLEIANFPFG